MSRIELKHLWKQYDDQVVLENISLKIEAGEFVTIVGASGCGKTTFLRLLLGEETPSRGQLLLDGEPMSAEPGPDRGVVFQRYSVMPHLNALQNVMLGEEFAGSPLLGRLFGAARRRAREHAMEALASVGLADAATRYPAELSGGMQQRLAIAQAIIRQPRILLLDEPFGALDPGIRADMHQLILELWRRTGVTVLMITHDLKEGFYLGTRLLVFDRPRHDPQAPGAYGARITYDIPLGQTDPSLYHDIRDSVGLPPEPELHIKEQHDE